MDPTKKEENVSEKPVIKSWGELKKEARAKAKEKQLKRLQREEKKAEEPDSDQTKKSETAPEKNPDIPVVEEVKEEKVVEPKVEEPRIDPAEVARKAAEEAATKVANETKEAFKSEIQKILDNNKDIQEKQKEADELIAAWDKEKRLPKDYQELISETMRIAEAKMSQRQRESESKNREEKPFETPKADPQTKQLEDYQKQITSDLEDIYAAKYLPRPTSLEEINNPNTTDEAARETQKVLAFGIKLNTERRKQGLEPVTSLNKIYFYHYKPIIDAQASQKPKSNQPPGADAPVSPSRNQSTTQRTAPRPFYQKGEDGHYHPKSWAQIKLDILRGKANS